MRKKQSEFIEALALLILYAKFKGYELTGGDLLARDGHKQGSFHYMRLAIDLNLFKDGKYLRAGMMPYMIFDLNSNAGGG